jgi:hypothetical protein
MSYNVNKRFREECNLECGTRSVWLSTAQNPETEKARELVVRVSWNL